MMHPLSYSHLVSIACVSTAVLLLGFSLAGAGGMGPNSKKVELRSSSPIALQPVNCLFPTSMFGPIVNESVKKVYQNIATPPAGYNFSNAPSPTNVACELITLFDSANSSIQSSLAIHHQTFINLTLEFDGNSTWPVAFGEVVDQWSNLTQVGTSHTPMIYDATWTASLASNTVSGPVYSNHQAILQFG